MIYESKYLPESSGEELKGSGTKDNTRITEANSNFLN